MSVAVCRCYESQIYRLIWKLSSAFINPMREERREYLHISEISGDRKKIFIDLKVLLLWAENNTSDSRCLPEKKPLLVGSRNGSHFYCNNIKSQLICTPDNTANIGCILHLSATLTSKVQLYPPLRAPDNVQVLDLVWCCRSWGTGNEIAVITTPERADELGADTESISKASLWSLSATLC